MKTRSASTKITLSLLTCLVVCSGQSVAQARGAPAGRDPQNGPDAYAWDIQRVDAPKYFEPGGDRSLRLDAAGHPHLAYGADALYHAWHDGTTWHLETVDPAPGVGRFASLALDAAGHPHISSR